MEKCVVCKEADGVFMNTASGGIHLCEPCFTELRVAIATHGVFGPVAVLHTRWASRVDSSTGTIGGAGRGGANGGSSVVTVSSGGVGGAGGAGKGSFAHNTHAKSDGIGKKEGES